jgi:hypothetical protein
VLSHFLFHSSRYRPLITDAYLTPSALLPRPPRSCRVSIVLAATLLLSAQLLNRSALRPVTGFPQSPWMVVTPSTTMASADFCLQKGRPPRIRYDHFPLILAAFTPGCFDPFWTLPSFASLSDTRRLSTQFSPALRAGACVFIQSRFCSPASSPRRFAPSQLPSASGSSGQRPLETFTPKLSPMPGVQNAKPFAIANGPNT